MILFFVGTLLCLYFGTYFGLFFWIKKHFDNLSQRLPAAIASFLAAMFMIGVAVCHVLFKAPTLTIYTMLGIVLVALLFLSAKWSEKKKIWVPLICIAGTYVLHKMMPDIAGGYLVYGAMGVVWMAVMTMVMFFDCLPLLSFFTMATWAFSFATVIFIDGAMPKMLAVGCWLAVAPLWAVIRVSAEEMKGRLGSFGSAFLGFIMGGVIAACVGLKAYNSAFALTSYYLFELLLFALAYLGLHPLGLNRGEFAYILVLQKGNPTRIIKVLFYHLMALALIAVLAWKTYYVWSVGLAVLIVLLDLYNRYKLFGQPDPSVRQLWRDTKDAVKNLWTNEIKPNATKEEEKHTEEKKKSSRAAVGTKKVKREKKK